MIVKEGETAKVRWHMSRDGQVLSYMVNNVICEAIGGVSELTVWARTLELRRFYKSKVEPDGTIVHRFDIRVTPEAIDEFNKMWATPQRTIFDPPKVVDPIDRSCREKRRYDTRDEALNGVAYILLRGRRGGHPTRTLRPYRCRHCDGWHNGHAYETADVY